MKVRRVYVKDSRFLSILADFDSAPDFLWVRGNLPEGERPKTVAIVGSRKNTSYGEAVAYKLAFDLASCGVIIVSGMAYGIDAAAHRGCLDAGGVTLAVLGTPIDQIYPQRNVRLAEKILEKGAIVSEYGKGSWTANWNFVRRNRIVSGLADAVVIVEATLRSGSLTTATWALEQGKELFAVPGDITRPMSVGCNKVIKQGAHVFTETEDVLGVLWPKKAKQLKFEVFGEDEFEVEILQAMKEGATDGDEIIEKTGLDAKDFNRTVTMLEIKGVIRSLGANAWSLA
ncbi:MAG: DNA-processing protein DprA [Candidatus Nomurabacteria bacterium]|jgi:DNA processing protein|nr:DNA-processing protein DprA [Candidatus Nomurabacteria bacterium]